MDSQYHPGAVVLVPSDELGWAPLKVVDAKGFGASASVRAAPLGSSAARELSREELDQLEETDALCLDGAPDMVKFTKLSEATLLHTLRVRYSRDEIYTRAGSILISVNPFKQLPIYTPRQMQTCKVRVGARGRHRRLRVRGARRPPALRPRECRRAAPRPPSLVPPRGCAPAPRLPLAQDADAKSLPELAPHVYALAEAAYRGMLIEQKQQALLISGESGAGKTEAVKACLRYVVSRSSDAAKGHAGGGTADAEHKRAQYIESCIMEANPLLEALGNAKTVRNGNSSRFGKWIEVQFDASGFITASRITSYLLEKSRVVEHGAGERTYHVLYQLCRGLTPAQAAPLKLLPQLGQFRYIGESAQLQVPGGACTPCMYTHTYRKLYTHTRAPSHVPGPCMWRQVPGVDDGTWWQATCKAMDVFGLTPEQQEGVRAVLASVLHLGNLTFDVVQQASSDDGCAISAACKPHLDAVASLLALQPAALEQALTVKSVGKFPVVLVPQPAHKASSTRDALGRALYGQLFDWTISRINATMSGSAGADSKRTIGMLDIFGFEAFQRNSLEQLLINFANEKLQARFPRAPRTFTSHACMPMCIASRAWHVYGLCRRTSTSTSSGSRRPSARRRAWRAPSSPSPTTRPSCR